MRETLKHAFFLSIKRETRDRTFYIIKTIYVIKTIYKVFFLFLFLAMINKNMFNFIIIYIFVNVDTPQIVQKFMR